MSVLGYLKDQWRGGQVFEELPHEDPRLGRHVLHDPRSRLYDARKLVKGTSLPTAPVRHVRRGPVLDQGSIGACTAFSALGVLMSGALATGEQFTAADAIELYRLETRIDNSDIPGSYEPDDTGSTGLWSMKALGQQRRIRAYYHAFRWNDFVKLLAKHPVSVGTVWLQSMYDVDSKGYLRVDRRSRPDGGHQYAVDELLPTASGDYDIGLTNSWGTGWGRGGRAWVRGADMRWLLSLQGDAVSPLR